jgi:hypothetical protein
VLSHTFFLPTRPKNTIRQIALSVDPFISPLVARNALGSYVAKGDSSSLDDFRALAAAALQKKSLLGLLFTLLGLSEASLEAPYSYSNTHKPDL